MQAISQTKLSIKHVRIELNRQQLNRSPSSDSRTNIYFLANFLPQPALNRTTWWIDFVATRYGGTNQANCKILNTTRQTQKCLQKITEKDTLNNDSVENVVVRKRKEEFQKDVHSHWVPRQGTTDRKKKKKTISKSHVQKKEEEVMQSTHHHTENSEKNTAERSVHQQQVKIVVKRDSCSRE